MRDWAGGWGGLQPATLTRHWSLPANAAEIMIIGGGQDYAQALPWPPRVFTSRAFSY